MSRAQEKVMVLLSTYNGEPFLQALLDSLAAQTFREFRLIVRDDGSIDRTVSILMAEARFPVTIIEDGLGNVGVARSFMLLLQSITADIYMFCDQDDVWLPSKVEDAFSCLCAAGLHLPLLYHCDLTIVDEELRMINRSFYSYDRVSPSDAQDLKRLVVQNSIVGCTMAFTEALVRACSLRKRLPAFMAMHDWWIVLCANRFGQIIYSDKATIYYRQHKKNVSGVGRRSWWQKIALQLSSAGVQRIRKYRYRVARQAEAFLECYGSQLARPDRRIVAAAARLGKGTGFTGWWLCFARGVMLRQTYMNAALLFSCMIDPLTRHDVRDSDFKR